MAKFYQVGGSVRDNFIGITSKDVDYAVEATSYDAMREAILERGGEIFLETPEYYTIRAKVPELGACDFVLCRTESGYKDGRHPTVVKPGTIYDDLARRDFRMNAIAIAEDGVVLDPYYGRDDIKIKLIRCVGRAEDRFKEDGLRMLRAIRFSVTKEFELDTEIEDLLRDEDFIKEAMRGVSIERVREELFRCFNYDTNYTFVTLIHYPDMRRWLFTQPGLWLKPTLEVR